jgi:hypothetical protein
MSDWKPNDDDASTRGPSRRETPSFREVSASGGAAADSGATDEGCWTDRDRAELLQLAELEALALVDADEDPVASARLERLFDAAPPSVQAEARALQERFATDPLLRSAELPSDSLRLRTIARVVHASEEESRAAAPIATIGPRQAVRGGKQGDRFSFDEVRSIIDGISRERDRMQSVRQPYWRVAAFILLAALSVSLLFNWRYVDVSEKFARFTVGEVIDAEMRALATDLAGFDFARAEHRVLVAVSPNATGCGSVYVDAASGRVAVLGLGFAPGETLEIVVRDSDSGLSHSQRFLAAAGFGKICEMPAELARRGTVEIRDSSGTVLFRA